MTYEFDEPFTRRWWAIVNGEANDCSFDEAIVLTMPSKALANRELARRQGLPVDDDDRLDEYHVVLPIHVDGIGWNSLDPCPEGWPER